MARIDELTIADEPQTWRGLGFAVEGDGCRLASVTVRLAGRDAGQGIVGWSLADVASTDLDGLPTTISGRHAGEAQSPTHPNGVAAIDHVVAISPDFPRSVKALQAAGLDLRRVREEPTPAGAPRQAFFRLGHEILELVQEPVADVERRGGAERPAHFWGLALLADDLDETARHFAAHASEPRAALQPGRRIVTVKRSAGLSFPLALMSREAG